MFGRALGQGKTDQALEICRIWAEGNPSTAGPYFSMARVYRQRGEVQKARDSYERIIKILPGTPAAENARKELGRLEK
jgi:Tfp pilus assembly protein PilF